MIELDKTEPIPWEDVAAALFKARGIESGLWFVGASLNFAATTNGWINEPGQPGLFAPTGLVGVQHLLIAPATAPGPMVFDAANPVALSFVVPDAAAVAAKKTSTRKRARK